MHSPANRMMLGLEQDIERDIKTVKSRNNAILECFVLKVVSIYWSEFDV